MKFGDEPGQKNRNNERINSANFQLNVAPQRSVKITVSK